MKETLFIICLILQMAWIITGLPVWHVRSVFIHMDYKGKLDLLWFSSCNLLLSYSKSKWWDSTDIHEWDLQFIVPLVIKSFGNYPESFIVIIVSWVTVPVLCNIMWFSISCCYSVKWANGKNKYLSDLWICMAVLTAQELVSRAWAYQILRILDSHIFP